MNLKVSSTAPSNIALIKYMGKTSQTENRPSNASLSWSLGHLTSLVEIESANSSDLTDSWEPLNTEEYFAPELSSKGQQRFINHFQFLKSEMGIKGHYIVRSANNFPADCGVASSASSFAALTLAAYEMAKLNNPSIDLTLADLSKLSRKGSGSSCRSLYPGWSYWETDGAVSKEFALEPLLHTLILIDEEKKQVSSSEAHRRVLTSSKFEGRVDRATLRLSLLERALSDGNWKSAYEICWDEFEDMHVLFETSEPPFCYRNDGSQRVVNWVKSLWLESKDGPIVTMDAGANVHLLWRKNQAPLVSGWLSQLAEKEPLIKFINSPGL